MSSEQNQRNKAHVLAYWQALDEAEVDQLPAVAARFLPQDFLWKGPAPLGTMKGPDRLASQVLMPLRQAMPEARRQIHIFMGGQSVEHVADEARDAGWVAGTGYFNGVAVAPFLGIPATDRPLRIRWIEFIRFDGDTPVECQVILDLVDWFEQVGLAVLPPSKGIPGVFPAPTAFDGVLRDARPSDETAQTLKLGQDLLYGGLNGFDQSDLSSMGMASYFHPNLKWYGPGGIGANLSFAEFEQHHQRPWLEAFPDRKVVGLESLFAEGRLLACSGEAGVRATHAGPYLGEPASGRDLAISGIDFWLRSGDCFSENWVFVDMIDLFDQMGVDLFERMRRLRDARVERSTT